MEKADCLGYIVALVAGRLTMATGIFNAFGFLSLAIAEGCRDYRRLPSLTLTVALIFPALAFALSAHTHTKHHSVDYCLLHTCGHPSLYCQKKKKKKFYTTGNFFVWGQGFSLWKVTESVDQKLYADGRTVSDGKRLNLAFAER